MRKIRLAILVILSAILNQACQTPEKVMDNPPAETIGVAHLREDGILTVMLRATGDSDGEAIVGDAMFAYRKGTEGYARYMRLVGGLNRGESKPVPAVNRSDDPDH